MIHTCPACGTVNDAWRPFCTRCSLRLDGARHGPPGMAGSALLHYTPVGAPVGSGVGSGADGSRRQLRARTRAAIAVLALAALSTTVFGGMTLAHHLSSDHNSAVAPPPKHWDPRLAPLARVAERLRGLRFKHPVAAGFYTDAAFTRLDTGGLDEPDSRRNLEQLAAELRALGVAPAGIDLGRAAKTLVSSTELAFYDAKTKRISVRGTKLDVAHDVTIVHELTHALQDQYFDLDAIERKEASSNSNSATALIEGDARDVEDRYVESLAPAQHAEYDAEQKRLGTSVGAAVSAVPDVLVLSEQAPYDLGERFVRVLRDAGGTAAVNRAFGDVPGSDWYFMDPVAYLHHAKVEHVSRPPVPHGAKLIDDEGESGDFSLFLVLAERIDPHTALAASDAWRGDHTVAYSIGNTRCENIDIAAQTASTGSTIESALRAWSNAMPKHHTAVVRRNPRLVELHACDGGAHTPPLTHQSLRAYALPVTRAALLDTFLGKGIDASTAWCASDQVVYGYSVADLNDPTGTVFAQPAFTDRLKGWLAACAAATSDS